MGFVCTIHQSLINYFGLFSICSLRQAYSGCCHFGEVAIHRREVKIRMNVWTLLLGEKKVVVVGR